jgi:hypothetical protein
LDNEHVFSGNERVFRGVPSYYSDVQFMDQTDSYPPDSKNAEYLEAIYTEKSNSQSDFLIRNPSLHSEESDSVIDLTNHDPSNTLENSALFNDFDEDFIPNDRPHSDFFTGNAELIEHFGKIEEDSGQEIPAQVSPAVNPSPFHFEEQLDMLEKSLPLMDMGDSADSLIPDKIVEPSKFNF